MSTICPRILADGRCSNPLCAYAHAVFTCDPCGFMCISQSEMDEHNGSRVHINKIRGESLVLLCPICRTRHGGQRGWDYHLRSRKHDLAAQRAAVDPTRVTPEEMEHVPKHTFCVTCNVHIQDIYWDRHLGNSKHLEKEKYAAFKVVLDDTEKDRNGVTVQANFDFGIVDLAVAASGQVIEGFISTSVPTGRITLVNIQLASKKGAIPGHSTCVPWLRLG